MNPGGKMKSIKLGTKALAVATLLFVAFAAAPAWASDWLSGPHTNLNIIGGPSCGSVPSGTGGGRIFVPLTTTGDSPKIPESSESTTFDATDTSIFLIQGPTFQVCNADACSTAVDCNGIALGGSRSTGAVFQLPCDVLTATGTTSNTCTQASVNSATYCIYAAAAGKPGGNADITTCGVDLSNNVVCSTNNAVLVRQKGGPQVQDVTTALTTLTCTQGVTPNCPCPTGTTCTFEIFNSTFQFFLWDYDNAGLKNAKLRFYPQPAGTATCPIP
jgi:hypothetical protein